MAKKTIKSGRIFFILGFAALFVGSGAFAYSLVYNLPDPERITDRAVVESTNLRSGEKYFLACDFSDLVHDPNNSRLNTDPITMNPFTIRRVRWPR